MLFFLAALLAVVVGRAATVAFIDTGIDRHHFQFTGQNVVNGWDAVAERSHSFQKNHDLEGREKILIYIQLRALEDEGKINKAQKNWLETHRKIDELLSRVGKFKRYAHGTHVAGILSANNPNLELLDIFGITPKETESISLGHPLSLSETDQDPRRRRKPLKNVPPPSPEELEATKKKLLEVAERETRVFLRASKYAGDQAADIVVYANGDNWNRSVKIVTDVFAELLKKPLFHQESADLLTRFFINAVLKHQRAAVQSLPNTLFVFPAGNAGLNNDLKPTTPAAVGTENSITVSATYKKQTLARFSNYGADIAAPGVNIPSAVPGKFTYLSLSGTSQAAANVARIASLIKDTNPKLSPSEIKKILMETVDKKGFLDNKVRAGGMANEERALERTRETL